MDTKVGHRAERPTSERHAESKRVLLLVEDNEGDATLVRDLVDDSGLGPFEVVHSRSLAEGLSTLKTMHVDVIVLDLRLPDSQGIETVRAIRTSSERTPIVVLTGAGDEALALACIDAGAQDCLAKSEVRSQQLNRAIGYAITRQREAQLQELQSMLASYRRMSSADQPTRVTASLAGSGAISQRTPDVFRQLVRDYYDLLEPFLLREADRVEASRQSAERIITAIGDRTGGPRDLIDVHVTALADAMTRFNDTHSRSVVVEARLLALEMMGLLVDYYRVGHRRRFFAEDSS